MHGISRRASGENLELVKQQQQKGGGGGSAQRNSDICRTKTVAAASAAELKFYLNSQIVCGVQKKFNPHEQTRGSL